MPTGGNELPQFVSGVDKPPQFATGRLKKCAMHSQRRLPLPVAGGSALAGRIERYGVPQSKGAVSGVRYANAESIRDRANPRGAAREARDGIIPVGKCPEGHASTKRRR
jgi:hypothetical protein